MRKNVAIVFVLAAWVPGCGGGGGSNLPTQATGVTVVSGVAAGTALTVVSGETGAPLPGATLNVGGRTLTTDSAGRATLAERVDLNAPVDVLASGFLDRQTLLRASAPEPFALWPKTSSTGLDQHFTATLVYTSTAEGAALAAEPLRRLGAAVRQVFIVAGPEIRDDAGALARLELGAAHVSAAVEGRVNYVVAADAPAGAVRFDVRFDPAAEGCGARTRAFAQRNLRGSEIVGGSVVFCVVDALYASTVTHELGHTFGLGHSPYEFEVMAAFFARQRDGEFSPREALVMRLMLQRPAGNRAPDNDRDARPSALARSETIVCG